MVMSPMSHLIMMRMRVSVISVYRYRLILLLNIGYWNNRLIGISVQHYPDLPMVDCSQSTHILYYYTFSYCVIGALNPMFSLYLTCESILLIHACISV